MQPVKLSKAQYDGVVRILCPYCRANLPSIRNDSLQVWMHGIPDTEHRFACEANLVRSTKVWVEEPKEEKAEC